MSFRMNFPKEGVAESAALGRQAINKISASELENKFKPLEMAVKAQNSLAYNSRSGNIGMFLRSIAQLPADERKAYLADRKNRQHYMDMMDQFKSAMQQEQGQGGKGNALNSMIQNFDFGGQQQQNPLEKIMQMIMGGGQQQQQPQMQQQPQQQPPMQMQQQAPQMQGGDPSNMQGNNVGSPEQESDATEGGQQQPAPSEQALASPYDSPTKLSNQDRQLYSAQMRANNSMVTPAIKARADNAEAFDVLLQEAQPEAEKAFKLGMEYNGVYGRGKKWLDMLKKDQPEKYVEYMKAKNSLVPLFSNGIRFLEAQGISHDAQEDAKRQIAVLDNMESSPETARQIFNNHFKQLQNTSRGIMRASQPSYPGVREKLAGIRELKGDYISPYKAEKKTQSRTQEAGNSKATKYATDRLSKGIVMPEFEKGEKGRQQGIAWFKRQSPQVQAAIKEHLRK